MSENSNVALITSTPLSVVRKENGVIKVLAVDSVKQQKITDKARDRTIISSRGYIAAPKHDFL